MSEKKEFVSSSRKFWERNRRSEGYLLKRRAKSVSISVIRGLLMFGLCFMIISPMLSRLSMSLMEERTCTIPPSCSCRAT
uniref:Putative sugar ABC transporter permease n=1 Tax=uncultured bacterium Ad_142_N07 TaxID=1489286 RepID=A0A3Q8DFD1_9BACT|nr:putative sugar ABC transporter permease [uncultured bacterium Ad_142_N07]